MKYFFTTRVKVVLVITAVLAAILTVTGSITGMSLPDMFVKGVLTPIRSGMSQLTARAEQWYDYIFEYESLLAGNQALKEKIAQIESDAREADAIARENERLRKLLGLLESHEDFKLKDARIIAWSSNDWTNTFTINRGTKSGIAVGQCAVTANGELVGVVSEVGTNYAVVKTVLDSSLEISATIATSGQNYNGMVQGGYSTGLDGLLRMNYLPRNAAIRNNDQVVTTGSTIYPRNLILGYVTKVGLDGTGVTQFALVKPAANVSSLEQVFIITEYNAG
jgi:rod shape-determining protein MreC